MPFFTPNYTRETAKEKIELAKKLLVNVEKKEQELFLELLQHRINDFETAIRNNPDPSEAGPIIQQYNRFARTVYSCLHRPSVSSFYIMNYLNLSYYPVAINDVTPEPIRHNISLTAAILGATLILAGCIAFAFNPIIGAILLPIGITMLAPSCISLLIPDSPDTSAKKLEEKIIFQAGAKLIDPSLTFDESSQYDEQIQAKVL